MPLLSFRDAKAFATKLAEQPNLAPLAVFDALMITGMRHVACRAHASRWKLLEAASARAAAARLDAPGTTQSIAIERGAHAGPLSPRARARGTMPRSTLPQTLNETSIHRRNCDRRCHSWHPSPSTK